MNSGLWRCLISIYKLSYSCVYMKATKIYLQKYFSFYATNVMRVFDKANYFLILTNKKAFELGV